MKKKTSKTGISSYFFNRFQAKRMIAADSKVSPVANKTEACGQCKTLPKAPMIIKKTPKVNKVITFLLISIYLINPNSRNRSFK